MTSAVIKVPELSLVLLVGASGSGKSTFARRHFKPTEVLSADRFRGMVSDDENDQAATRDAFEVLHYIAGKRLAGGRLTVVDATNVQPEARRPLIGLARAHHCLPVAIVFDLPERVCVERNLARPDRDFGPQVVRRQRAQLRRSLGRLEREGLRHVTVLRGQEEVDAVTVQRERSWSDRRDDSGPFDIVGDVHGCLQELCELLARLGWELERDAAGAPVGARHPHGRRAVFLGDLVDRGPATPGVLRLVMGMVAGGSALCVPGNHEQKLLRALRGRKVQVTHGLAESLAQLAAEPPGFAEKAAAFLDGLVSHYVLDHGRLVVAHAGLRQEMHGRASAAVRSFALYGETTGESDEYGLPVRYPWADDYRGGALVVYGHTPASEPTFHNNTICIDTGCVFGGRLTALRYPQRELVSVPAVRTWYQPARPFLPPVEQAPAPDQDRPGDLLDIDDVLGKRVVATRLLGRVTVREEQARAALEVMGRFAADPRWLVYLPPTMAPTATTELAGLLEHPAEAFAAYRQEGVARVICEEKHMGSRAVVIVCRDEQAARRRFGTRDGRAGVVLTRTGRPFFPDRADGPGGDATEEGLLDRVRAALDAIGLWEELASDWLLLDAELLPWSFKADELLRHQYAAVGAAASAMLGAAVTALETAAQAGRESEPLLARQRQRAAMVDRYMAAYGAYCWPVASVEDLRLAPFQVLAGEGRTYLDRDHRWHLDVAGRLAAVDGRVLIPTTAVGVDTTDPAGQAEAIAWWEALTVAGGEGMVVKPLDGLVAGRRRPVQPGLKCRGPDYLRIVYGPEYTAPEHLARLRQRALGRKRSLAVREFALGVEAVERFVRGEPLWRVHECVFGVLALESEPVDPRL